MPAYSPKKILMIVLFCGPLLAGAWLSGCNASKFNPTSVSTADELQPPTSTATATPTCTATSNPSQNVLTGPWLVLGGSNTLDIMGGNGGPAFTPTTGADSITLLGSNGGSATIRMNGTVTVIDLDTPTPTAAP